MMHVVLTVLIGKRSPKPRYGSSFPSFIQLLFLLSLCAVKNCNARLIDGYEQVVQNWDVCLNCRDGEANILFPLSKESMEKGVKTESDSSSSKIGLWRRKSLKCHLALFPNGTFSLKPKDRMAMDLSDDEQAVSCPYMPLRGEWSLRPNPYCITDRHFDELELESYPRVQKRVCKIQSDQEGTVEQLMQEVRIKLACHVSGRYGTAAIRNVCGYPHGKRMGRLTRGTLLWNVIESPLEKLPWWKRRRVQATFSGRPERNFENNRDIEDR